LRSADPFDPPKINYRLFDDEDDLERLTDGMAIARDIITHDTFGRHVIDRSSYPDGQGGRDADRDFVRANSRGFMHPVGTCRMGNAPDAPVTPSLEVKGMDNLWVADASVFPNHVSGNINATVMMIGEKAADLIRAKL
jgi:choline dehydrogenase